MSSPARRLPWMLGIGVLLLILTLGLAFLLAQANSRIARTPRLPVYGQVADFTLTNQTGRAVSLADLRGRVWIADIIFTRCAGPCPIMTQEMKSLQDALPPDSPARLVTLTTDPDYDTAAVLRRYAERFGADTNRWMFLTGTKKEIANLAVGSLKFSAVETKPEDRASPADLFVHSTIFVLIDQRGQLRGIYQTSGEGVDWQKSKRDILAAAQQLERAG